jgi:hypothetical protein
VLPRFCGHQYARSAYCSGHSVTHSVLLSLHMRGGRLKANRIRCYLLLLIAIPICPVRLPLASRCECHSFLANLCKATIVLPRFCGHRHARLACCSGHSVTHSVSLSLYMGGVKAMKQFFAIEVESGQIHLLIQYASTKPKTSYSNNPSQSMILLSSGCTCLEIESEIECTLSCASFHTVEQSFQLLAMLKACGLMADS